MSFSEFYQRSINEPEKFWAEQARRIDWQTPFTQTLDHSNPPFARWFCEGRTNLCHNAIDRWLEKQPGALALIAVSSETEEELSLIHILHTPISTTHCGQRKRLTKKDSPDN